MICRSGRIVRIEDGQAQIAAASTSDCDRCQAGHGCGLSLLRRGQPAGDMLVWAPADPGFHVGQHVQLAIDPLQLAAASLHTYGPPLAGLVGGIAVGQALGSEPVAAVAGGLGLLSGLLLARRGRYRPQIKIIAAEHST